MNPSLRAILGCCTISLLLTACGSPAERAIEQGIERETGGEADVDLDAKTMRVTTSAGTVTTGAQAVPSDWPADVAVYPGSTVQFSAATVEDGHSIVLTTSDAPANVLAFYKEKLVSAGWSVQNTVAAAAFTILSASKDTRNIALQVATNGTQTTVTIGLTGAKK